MTEREFAPTQPADLERPAPATPAGGLSTADIAAGNPSPRADGTVAAREAQPADRSSTPLFASDQAQAFRDRWADIQTGFVDEPRRAVEEADGLVAEVMQRLARVFADERAKLEQQWSRGDDISTEDLRVALQRYRTFFDRLLSI